MARSGTRPALNKSNFALRPEIPASQKLPAAEFLYIADRTINPGLSASFPVSGNTVSVLNEDKIHFGTYTQIGNLSFVKDASVAAGAGIGNGLFGIINVDTNFTVVFSSDFEVSYDTLSTGKYKINCIWNGTKFEVDLVKIGQRTIGGSGISEAPIDGNQYARKDAGWEKVIASGGSGTGVFEPVQDITELKALNTTDGAVWKDKWALIVEDEESWYRYDRDSAVSESLPKIVAPTTGPGRFFQTPDVDLSAKADKANVLELDNITEFTPDGDYEPATKKYVVDNLPDISGKADKAVPTFSGNLAQLDSTGNLEDTGEQAHFIDIYNDVADATKTFLNNNENWLSGTTVLDQVTVEGKAGYRYKGTDFFFECINQNTWVRFPTDAQYFNPFNIPSTEKTKLENTGNWAAKVYTGTALVNCPIGSEHYDANYYFKFVDNNVPIRIARI
jgi:hypothetical protein